MLQLRTASAGTSAGGPDASPGPASGGPRLPAREPAASTVARNLVVARDLVGMTQHELAARSGVSRATIAQLESGGGDPRLSTIADVAEALGVSPVILLSGRKEVTAFTGLCRDLADRPVGINDQDVARMHAFAGSVLHRDWSRAARIGASVARAAGCKSPGAAATAGVFSVVAPGRGTAIGTALGRLLE